MMAVLLIVIALGAVANFAVLARHAVANHAWPRLEAMVLGAVTNFFDTLGIGSFAPTTAWLKFRRLVPDQLIPPTLIAGLTPPSMVQALIFLALLGTGVDPVLLIGSMVGLSLGGLVGAPLVYRGGAGRGVAGQGNACRHPALAGYGGRHLFGGRDATRGCCRT